ncbi:5`-3` DNA helicase [Fusarium beomiforme]|uniref:ATP-dependent DNA helicase n=1 Tax=Fusarium beomiforme TaxID=44412 RepID=A0A9P5A7A8_9HYPO|nr:5`-3` DNA helicase [Fusarium beomiforme]
MRGPAPQSYPSTLPLERKRKNSETTPDIDIGEQSLPLSPSRKRTQHESSSIGISSGGEDNVHHDPLAPPETRPVMGDGEPTLSTEQQELVDTILRGQRNVFFTGSAGCGKSTVLKTVIRTLKETGKKVYVCSPTGLSAVQINGRTTYSYMGWSPECFKEGIDTLKAITWRNSRQHIRKTQVLIIDEISMVSSDFLNRVNDCLKSVREDKKELPFGGIQVVATGDFCQLPPVNPFEYCYECGSELGYDRSTGMYNCPQSPSHGPWADENKWAFKSVAWNEANFACFNLTRIHRQDDPIFINMLQKCRLGIPFTDDDIDLLVNHECNVENATQLLCKRNEVTRINREKLKEITEYEQKQYRVFDGFDWNGKIKWENDKYGAKLQDGTLKAHKDHRFDRVVNLKETMQVMLQVNLDIEAGLVNGS